MQSPVLVFLVLGFLACHGHGLAISKDLLAAHYSATPAGYVLKHCIRTHPSGTHLKETEQGTTATFPNGSSILIPPCTRPLVGATQLPVVVRHAALPPDYDGWLAYTAFNTTAPTGFDSFLGTFSVPHIPRRVAHIVYLFTGLQNIDWVPLVDPESEGANFDIIQPVLQYPGDNGNYWSVKSWYVTLTAGASASDELPLNAGDLIFGNMTRTGPTSWYIGGQQQGSGKSSYLQADHPRLRVQSWAYNVLEAYGVTGCENYPDNTVEFTGLSLSQGGSKLPPTAVTWRVNPKPDPKHYCGEAIKVDGGDHVTVSFTKA